MTRAHALDLFNRLGDLHASRDPAGVGTVFAEDAEYQDDGWHETARGHDAIERFFRAVWQAFPDFRIELLEGPYVSDDEHRFSVRGRLSGTMRGKLEPPGFAPTGTPVVTEFAGFYEYEGDRMIRGRVLMNVTELGMQIGALPPAGSRGERFGVWLQRLQARRRRVA